MKEEDFEESDDQEEFELWPFVPRLAPIPTVFHSLADGPFTRCMICERDLTEPSVRYLVERIFRGKEPIVEYALCFECQEGMCSELSEESLQRIEQFYQQLDFEARVERLRPHAESQDVSPWLENCLVTDNHVDDCHGYQIMGVFQGPYVELSAIPMMLSSEAVEQILKLLSKKTRERLDDFMGDHFGMPPEFCEHPDFFPVLL